MWLYKYNSTDSVPDLSSCSAKLKGRVSVALSLYCVPDLASGSAKLKGRVIVALSLYCVPDLASDSAKLKGRVCTVKTNGSHHC